MVDDDVKVADHPEFGVLSGIFESMGSAVAADGDALMFDDAIDSGLTDAVKDNDSKFPPELRLSKSGRKKKR